MLFLVLRDARSSYVLDVVLLIALPAAAVVLLRFAPKIKDAISWSLWGEPGSLMAGGFMPGGSRFRRTVELQAIVSRLALITRLNLPVCPALEAAARGESPRTGRVLQKMSRYLAWTADR